MGKKYRVLILGGNEAGLVEHNDIVELEDIQDEKKETLENKFFQVIPENSELAEIAKEHFQSHPEELGLVRIEDVLALFDRKAEMIGQDVYRPSVAIEIMRRAIEGMKQ